MKHLNHWLNTEVLADYKSFLALDAAGELTPTPVNYGNAVRFGNLWLSQPGDASAASLRPKDVHPRVWGSLLDFGRAHHANTARLYLTAGVALEGPKVFCPTPAEVEALMRIDVTVTWDEYRQPFDTLVVVIPEGVDIGTAQARHGRTHAVVSRYDKDRRFWAIMPLGTGRGHLLNATSFTGDHYEIEMEYDMRKCDNFQKPQEGTPNTATVEDIEVLTNCRRIAANAALILCQVGARYKGYANQEYARKLMDAGRKKLPAKVQAANQTALKLIPQVYGFDQEIKIYDEEGEAPGRQDGQGGYSVKPHWRRGYWQRQVCGKDRLDRRLQFRRPLLVNSHLLAGPLVNTRVTMTHAAKDGE